MITKYGNKVDACDKVIEECCEMIHLIQKIKRFGLYSTHPEIDIPNDVRLYDKILDLQEALQHMVGEYDL